jgi:hypothetical protein
MNGTKQLLLDVVEIDLGNPDDLLRIYINVYDNSLSKKWLAALNNLLTNNNHLEKNYCFLGFANGPRDGKYICEQINKSIRAMNQAGIGYHIDNHFSLENSLITGPVGLKPDGSGGLPGGSVNHDQLNLLHRYFEDLQGHSGQISDYYWRADNATRWHIRQLNLLCHEFESWALSAKKQITAPEWQRPSQLMCWLKAPRFQLDNDDFELFGVDTINRPLGGVYVGVNKGVSKHHWEVFVDEAHYDPSASIDNLTTTGLRVQVEAAGDFDIEWGNDPGNFAWQKKHLEDFRVWLRNNGLDPEDKTLTIGHPQVGQVHLTRSFDTKDYKQIWQKLNTHLNVYSIQTSQTRAVYEYSWSDPDYMEKQIKCLG